MPGKGGALTPKYSEDDLGVLSKKVSSPYCNPYDPFSNPNLKLTSKSPQAVEDSSGSARLTVKASELCLCLGALALQA